MIGRFIKEEIHQIVGTLGDEAYNFLLIVLIAIFADNRFMATLQLTEFLIQEVRKAREMFISFFIRTHRKDYTMQNTNPLTEIGAIVLAALLVIAGGLLLYAGKIDAAFASSMFILAAGLLGVTGALKAPSATQQTQINTLQQGMQDLIDLFGTHTHPVPPTPAPPTQPVQAAPSPFPVGGTSTAVAASVPVVAPPTPQFVPDPGVSMAAYSTSQMPVVQPGTQP